MTVLLVGTTARVTDLAGELRRRGIAVAVLGSLGVVALMLRSERIRAVVVNQEQTMVDWEASCARLISISPGTRIVFVAHDDPRSVEELAAEVAADQSPSSNT